MKAKPFLHGLFIGVTPYFPSVNLSKVSSLRSDYSPTLQSNLIYIINGTTIHLLKSHRFPTYNHLRKQIPLHIRKSSLHRMN